MRLAIRRKATPSDGYIDIDSFVTSLSNFTRKVNFNGDIILCEPVITCNQLPPSIAVGDYIYIGYTDGLFSPLWQGNITSIEEQADTTFEIRCKGFFSGVDQNASLRTVGGAPPREYAKVVWEQAAGVTLPAIPGYTDSNYWSECRLSAPQSTLGNLEVARLSTGGTQVSGFENGSDIPSDPLWSKTDFSSTQKVKPWLKTLFYLGNNKILGMFFGSKKPLCLHKQQNAIMPAVRVSFYCCSDDQYTHDTYSSIGVFQQILTDWSIEEQNLSTMLYPSKGGLDGEEREVYQSYISRDFNGNKVVNIHGYDAVKVKQPTISKTGSANAGIMNLPAVKLDYDTNHTGSEAFDQLSVSSGYDFGGRFYGEQYSIFDPTHPNSQTPSNRSFCCTPTIVPDDFSFLLTSLNTSDIVCRAILVRQTYLIETVHCTPFTLKDILSQLTFLSGLTVTENSAGELRWCNLYPWTGSHAAYPISLTREYALSIEKQETTNAPKSFTFNFTGVFGDTYQRQYVANDGDGELAIALCQGQFLPTMGAVTSSANRFYCGSNRWDGCPGLDGTTITNGGHSGGLFKLLADTGNTADLTGNINFSFDSDYSYTPTGTIPSVFYPTPFLGDNSTVLIDGVLEGKEPLLDISPVLQAREQIKTIYGGLTRTTYRVEIADENFLRVQVGEIIDCDLPYIGKTWSLVLEVTLTLQTISLVVVPLNKSRYNSYSKRSAY